MTDYPAQALICTLVLSAAACSARGSEQLPAVREPALFQAAVPCVAAPPLAPIAEPVARGLDPQACLPPDLTTHDLLVKVTVEDGRVKNFRVEGPSAYSHELTPTTMECLVNRFAAWQYSVSVCPAHPSVSHLYVRLRPGVSGASGSRAAVEESVDE
jgi:hypothetical protein